ncbi:hypothetical protein ACFL1L_04265 [Thermoplasmatota archaeon]
MKKHLIVSGIVFILLIIGFSGCIGTFQDIIIDDSLYQTAPRDSLTINNIQLKKDLLRFNVSYGGGCEEHEFKLIATSFMESYPVQVNIVLSHEDNDDPCDMWVTETLIFNILPLKKSYQQLYSEESGTIVMNIDGWGESINYEF